jgi:hypothetical protein
MTIGYGLGMLLMGIVAITIAAVITYFIIK